MSYLSAMIFRILEKFGIRILKNHYYNSLICPNIMELLNKYKVECDSVLHIGGHLAEEASLYKKNGITSATFIEGDPAIFPEMQVVLASYPQYSGISAMLSNKGGVSDFYVASNEGASSSILAPGRHLTERPDIQFDEVKMVETVTLDSLGLGEYDLVVIDVQGAEQKVLEGGMETISKAKAIWVEVNAGSMYEGDANSSDIVASLADFFVPCYINMSENLWGDALFIRKSSIGHN
jgi:FkbM family methyltransferase